MFLRFLKSMAASFALLLCFASAAHAVCEPGWCRDERITTFYISDHLYLWTSGDESQLNCDLFQGDYLTLRRNHQSFDAIYAFLLSAYAQDEPVMVRVYEGSDGCQIAYARGSRP